MAKIIQFSKEWDDLMSRDKVCVVTAVGGRARVIIRLFTMDLFGGALLVSLGL